MNHCITPEFAALLGKSRLESLNSHPSSVYGLDSEFNISYLNPAWFKFAEDNANNIFNSNEWSLGRNIFDAIPDVLHMYYRDLFGLTLKENKSPVVPRQSEYECSSPELYRRFSMHLYSMGKGGFVVVNSLLIEESYISQLPIEGILKLDEEDYLDKKGFLHQCSNCRRVQNLTTPERWDWVPKFIVKPYPKTSHMICSPCMQHYYLG